MTSSALASRGAHLLDLAYELVTRELKLRYKRSTLGVLWSLVTPLAQLVVFTLVFQSVLRLNVPNYPLFVFVGVLAWNWFQTAVFTASGAITENRDLVRRPGFPSVVLPAVTVATNFVHYVLAVPILLAFVVWSEAPLTPAVLWLVPLLALQFALTLGVAYVVASLNVTFRDVQHLLGVALTLLFYLTPVFYASESVPEQYRAALNLNPLGRLLDAQRAVLLEGRTPDPASLASVAALALVLLVVGFAVFRSARERFVEEL